MEIYFDNSATTKISEGARKKMLEAMDLHFGNPSSLHKKGLDAEHIVSEARESILKALGVQRATRGELIFTSGGTEANNMAIFGSVYAKSRRGDEKILTTDSEHASVLGPLSQLEKEGFKVIKIPTKGGVLDLDEVRKNAKGVILATFMHVNNETGAIYNVSEAFKIIRELSPSAVLHTDCVQAFMKVKLSKKSLGADLITLSAHKINGAKGTGALYISPETIKAKKITPILIGGGQEEGLRSGTENVYGIASFGQATKEHLSALSSEIEKMSAVRTYLLENLKKIPGISFNTPELCAPHILNISVEGLRSEIVLHDLSSKGIYVSSGSACSSHSQSKSNPVLLAFGVDPKSADSAIRISLCPDNTIEEADYFIKAIENTVNTRQKR